MQQESADSWPADLDMNYGQPYQHTLSVFPSTNPPCPHQAGRDRSSRRQQTPVDSGHPNRPSDRAKEQEGSAESLTVDLDMNYGNPITSLSFHLLLGLFTIASGLKFSTLNTVILMDCRWK